MIFVETDPCADCGTTGGKIRERRIRPRRFCGKKFGFAGVLCERCKARHAKRYRMGIISGRDPEMTEIVGECDLCGKWCPERRYSGAVWDIKDWICGGCLADLRAEQAEHAQAEGRKQELMAETQDSRPEIKGRHDGWLPILNRCPHCFKSQRLTIENLTLQAQCRLMVVEARKRERRAG